MNVLNQLDPTVMNHTGLSGTVVNFQPLNERTAINAIQKSLMQYESAQKTPVYNTSSVSI